MIGGPSRAMSSARGRSERRTRGVWVGRSGPRNAGPSRAFSLTLYEAEEAWPRLAVRSPRARDETRHDAAAWALRVCLCARVRAG